MELISFPLFSQRDDKWRLEKLGTSTSTLGKDGCLVTDMAGLCKYYGKDTDPSRLNTALVAINGYKSDNLYKWYEGIPKIFPDILCTKVQDTPNLLNVTQFAEIDEEIKNLRPVVIKVDFLPGTPDIEQHYVVIIGKDGDDYVVADPYYGDMASLSRYGKPAKAIQRYVFHKGPVPEKVDTVSKVFEKVEELKRSLADTQMLWREDIKAKERLVTENEDLETKYIGEVEARKSWDKWFNDLWVVLSPVGKDKTPQNILGEIQELIQKEDLLQEKIRDLEVFKKSYETLFEGVSQTIDYSGNDMEGLLRRLHEVVDSKNEAKEPLTAEESVSKYITGTKKNLLGRFLQYFRSHLLM